MEGLVVVVLGRQQEVQEQQDKVKMEEVVFIIKIYIHHMQHVEEEVEVLVQLEVLQVI